MNKDITDYKFEIEKINQRIKEYLWKKWYLFKIKRNQPKNYWTKFLEK